MVAHINWLNSIDWTFLSFLQFWMEFDLKMIEVIDMVGFTLYIASWFTFLIAASCDDPMRFILCPIIVYLKTHFLSDLITITTSSFVNTLMSVKTCVFTFRNSSTVPNVYLRLLPNDDVWTCCWVTLEPSCFLIFMRHAFMLVPKRFETTLIKLTCLLRSMFTCFVSPSKVNAMRSWIACRDVVIGQL